MKKAERIEMMIRNNGGESVTEYRKGRESNFFMVRVGGLWGLEKSTSGCTCGVFYADTREAVEAYIEANGYKAVKMWTPEPKKLYELEMTRNNVTPRAFYGMVRRALLDKGGVELESWVGTDGYWEWTNPSTVCDAHSTENETICKKPFDFQIAYKGVYNVILEFQFDADNRGTGYAYICEYEAEEQPAPETEPAAAQEAANDEPATDNKEEPKMTLQRLYMDTLHDFEEEAIDGVVVHTDGGEDWATFDDVLTAWNFYGDREIEPIYLGGDEPASMTEPDAHGMIHVALVETETAGQPAPDAGEPDALEVVRILGETLNLIKDNGDEVKATKARIALWEQVDEFKRRGVTLNVEYGTDGRFVGVTEPKAGMKFDELPESVQGKVKETLRAYDDCSVTYERGAYRVSAGVGIKASYAPDFKVCGRYAADDIFTPEERVLNYANSFYSYPPEYCGERDYRMMKAAQERGAKLEYDSAGNIVAAA